MKSRTKRILAFLCAVVLFVTAVFTDNAMKQAEAETEMSTQATSTEPTPVKLKGFKNLTIGDFLDSNREKLMPGKYTEGFYRQALGVKNMNNTLFSTRITYHSGFTEGYRSSLLLGGAGEWQGFNIHPSTDGTILYIEDTWSVGGAGTLPNGSIAINASDVVVEKFVDDEFLLQLSFEYGEADASNKTTFTLGVYIEGELYNKYDISNWDMNYVGNYLQLYQQENTGITLENVELREEPVVVDGFDNITITDFTKSDGTTLSAGTYMGEMSSSLKDESSFNNKLLSMYVTYTGGGTWNNSITLAGKAMYNSFALRPNNEGTELQFVTGDWGSSIATDVSFIITAEEAGVSSFVDNEFLLQISFLYGTETNGTADLTLGIYVDGKDCGTKTFTGCNMANTGTSLCTVIYDPTNKNIILDEVTFDPFAGYDMISVEDFVDASGKEMESKAYAYDAATPNSTFSLKNASETFANKLLSMKVKFGYKTSGDTNYDMRMVIGGENAWSGIFVYVNADDELCIDNYVAPEAYERINAKNTPASSFLNTQFTLQMAFKDTSNGLAVKVFIDGTLCGNFTWSGVTTSDYNNQIHLRRNLKDSFIIVSDPDAEEFPADPAIMPDPSFERITFGSFGFVNGTYDAAIDGIYDGNLDKKVLCGKIKFEGNSFSMIRLGGIDSSWDYGLHLAPLDADTMQVQWWKNGAVTDVGIENFTSDIAEVKFMGSVAYDLMISMEVLDADLDGVNDVRFGVWFNNKLYGDRYYDVSGVGDKLGNRIGITPSSDGTVTLNSVKEYLPQPGENLQKVTFHQYGVKDGTYESAPDINVKGSYIDTTIAGTVLCGDVQLHNASAGTFNIFLGSTDDVWKQGVRLVKYDGSETFTLTYQTSAGVQATWDISTAKAGVDFINEQFNLMWSMEMVDNDGGGTANDLKIGLWFDGFLYQGQYIYINDFGEGMLGNTFATYCPTGASITLGSIYELTKLPDKDFDKITFSDFGLETQEVVCDGANWVAKGTAKDNPSLDRVVFSGDFRFAENAPYQIRYAGDGGNFGWNGLGVYVQDDYIEVTWFKDNEKQVIVGTDAASAKLTSTIKNTFNLMLSTELVDEDGDGIKDIKVGVWFNEILCDYKIVEGWGDQLGNGFGIYGANGNTVMIRNVGDYQKNPYYFEAEDVSSYRESGTYPTEPGYVFAGWYKDAEYTDWVDKDETCDFAWAKFLEDDVLSVKTQPQLTIDSDNDGKADTLGDTTALRFVTTVDNLDYRRLSFYLSKETAVDSNEYGKEFNTAMVDDENARMVYKKLYAIGSDSETIKYIPTVFSWQSEYFKTFSVTNITKADYKRNIKVVPYWITMDGTEVRGKELITCVEDYINYNSQKVSVDFIGDDTLPITGFNGPYVVSDANDAKLFPNYITDEYFRMIAESGVNVIIGSNLDYNYYPDQVKKALKLGEKYGIGIYVKDSALKSMSENEVEQRIAEYRGYESFVGIFVTEEPGDGKYKPKDESNTVDSYESLTTILNNMDILTYVDMFPIADTAKAIESWWGVTDKTNYKDYVEKVNSTLNPAALMWDYYPFAVPKTEDETSRKELKIDKAEYFWNMAEIRRQAQGSKKPFWAYVQAGSNWNDDEEYFSTQVYAPTEGQFHWNMNTSLAFGAQGIQYFPLIQPYHFAYAGSSAEDKVWDFERNGLIGAFGNKTQWYEYAQEANEHVAAMDHILMNSYNEQIIALGDAATDISELISDTNMDVKNSASYKKLTSVSDGANVLIGCFDYKGKTALYVVNYDYDAEQNGITLNFDGTQNITKYENATETKTTGANITLNMTAGEGILLVIE